MRKDDSFDNKLIFKELNFINDNEYLKRLYKIYSLVNSFINDDQDYLGKLNDIEDYIFTVNGEVLSQKERIELEFNEILDKYNEVNPVKQKEVEFYIEIIHSLLNYDLNEKNILYVKKIIALVKCMLGLNTGFLYAGYLVFKEKIRNLNMNKNYKNMLNFEDSYFNNKDIDNNKLLYKKYYDDENIIKH